MRKPTYRICKDKGAEQLRSTAKLISAFVFATQIVQSLFLLHLKFQASSLILSLHSSFCVLPVQEPLCWFSHVTAHLFVGNEIKLVHESAE